MTRHHISKDSDNEHPKTYWKMEEHISETYTKYNAKLVERVSKFNSILDKHLSCIKMAKHQIELISPEDLPISSRQYRVEQKACKFEKQWSYKMLRKNVIELAVTVWASRIVFLPKRNEALWLFVDYSKPKAITICKSYLMLGRD